MAIANHSGPVTSLTDTHKLISSHRYAKADTRGAAVPPPAKQAKRAQPAEVTQFEVPDSGETNTEGGYMDVSADAEDMDF